VHAVGECKGEQYNECEECEECVCARGRAGGGGEIHMVPGATVCLARMRLCSGAVHTHACVVPLYIQCRCTYSAAVHTVPLYIQCQTLTKTLRPSRSLRCQRYQRPHQILLLFFFLFLLLLIISPLSPNPRPPSSSPSSSSSSSLFSPLPIPHNPLLTSHCRRQ
jgi:hypothetical protein